MFVNVGSPKQVRQNRVVVTIYDASIKGNQTMDSQELHGCNRQTPATNLESVVRETAARIRGVLQRIEHCSAATERHLQRYPSEDLRVLEYRLMGIQEDAEKALSDLRLMRQLLRR